MRWPHPVDHRLGPPVNEEWSDWLDTVSDFCSSVDDNDKVGGLLRVPIRLEGVTVSALVDPGSARTYIHHAFFSKLPKAVQVKREDSEHRVRLADNFVCQSQGCLQLPIGIMNKFVVSRLQIMSELCTDIILRLDFLRKAEIIIDLPSHKWQFKNQISWNGFMDSEEQNFCCFAEQDPHLTLSEENILKEFISEELEKFRSVSGRTSFATHRIDTGAALPIKLQPYRMSPAMHQVVVDHVDKMLADDACRGCLVISNCPRPKG